MANSSKKRANSSSRPTACTSSGKPRVEALVAGLLGEGLASLRKHAHFMQDTRDPEIVHEARVAVRRMRAALRVFPLGTSAGKARVTAAQKGLQALGRVLGEARDWDVIATELLPAQRARLEKGIGKAAFEQLLKKVLGAQMHANAAARRFVAGTDFEDSLARIDRLRLALEAAGSGGNARKGAAFPALNRQRARVRDKASGLRKLDAAARHKLRIEGKRLRYAVELCAPLLRHSGKKWLRALKHLQEALGTVTDARMLVDRIRSLDAAAARLLEANERICVRRQIPEVAKLLNAWRKARVPWKTRPD